MVVHAIASEKGKSPGDCLVSRYGGVGEVVNLTENEELLASCWVGGLTCFGCFYPLKGGGNILRH